MHPTLPTPALRMFALATLVGLAACDSAGPERPGIRTVSLLPEATNGSAVIRLVGGDVTDVVSQDGPVYFSSQGDTTRVVVLRVQPGPIRFDVVLGDPGATVSGSAVQVGTGENTLRPDASVYRVEVNP